MSLPALTGTAFPRPSLRSPARLVAPAGFAFLTDSNGRFIADESGALLIVETE